MKIYLLRHGETNLNKEQCLSCSDKAELNETGLQQAKEASKLLESISYDMVISSPYKRARITAEIANNNRTPIIFDNRLRERDAGILDGKPFTKTDMLEFLDYNKNINYEGAENIRDFCERVWAFLDEIKEKYPDKNILLTTHNIVIRAIKAYIFNIPEDGNIYTYGIRNGAIEEHSL